MLVLDYFRRRPRPSENVAEGQRVLTLLANDLHLTAYVNLTSALPGVTRAALHAVVRGIGSVPAIEQFDPGGVPVVFGHSSAVALPEASMAEQWREFALRLLVVVYEQLAAMGDRQAAQQLAKHK
eukprot:gene51521-64084_t